MKIAAYAIEIADIVDQKTMQAKVSKALERASTTTEQYVLLQPFNLFSRLLMQIILLSNVNK